MSNFVMDSDGTVYLIPDGVDPNDPSNWTAIGSGTPGSLPTTGSGQVDIGAIASSAASGNTGALSWLDQMVKAAPQIAAGISAFQLSQINVQRARQNLPPLSSAYNPGFNVGLTGNTMMYIGIGLVAVLLLSRK